MQLRCGIDWAERHHDVAIIDQTGTVRARARIGDDAAGFTELLALLAVHGRVRQAPIPVAIETAKGLLVAGLRGAEGPVFAARRGQDQARPSARGGTSGAALDSGRVDDSALRRVRSRWQARRLEGRFVWLAIRALRLGVNVILDFGVWGKDERSALRSLAAEAGATCELVYLAVDTAEQRRRVGARLSDTPELTFQMSQGDLHRFGRLFQVPDQNELTSSQIDPPPVGCPTWKLWASRRWPSSIS
jgi:hypothetical protein